MRVRVLSCPLPLRWVGPFYRPVRFILRQGAKERPVDTLFDNRLLMTLKILHHVFIKLMPPQFGMEIDQHTDIQVLYGNEHAV